MANIVGVQVGTGRQLVEHWWQWVLLGLTFGSVLIGTSYIVFSLLRILKKKIGSKDGPSKALNTKVSSHLQKYAGSPSQLTLEKSEKRRPTSLAVYLGGFDTLATPAQMRMLSNHDTIIFNPLESNVVGTVVDIRRNAGRSINLIGRIDLEAIMKIPQDKASKETEKSLISGLDEVMTIIMSRFKDSFTAVLLAGWEILPNSIFIELSDVLSTLGLGVYLETSSPEFLKQTTVLGIESVTGLVIRNGLILPDGQRRDCFSMENLRITIKAFVSQACLRDFSVLAWETLDDDANLPSAVLRRTFTWCGFYSVVPWIGPQSALYDASVDTARFQPLSAFDWLKESRVMDLQKMWKTKRGELNTKRTKPEIRRFASVLPRIQSASNDAYCRHENTKSSLRLTEKVLESPELSILRESAHGDALATSSIGNSADGLGCFPLGLDLNAEDFQQIVASQKNLAKLNLLDMVTKEELREYGNTLQRFLADPSAIIDLKSSNSSHCEEAIVDLADFFTQPSDDDESKMIQVFRGLPSGLQRNSKKHFWAVYQVQPSGTTDIYISKNLQDPISVLIHTYMSAQGLQRRLCFAAEVAFARFQDQLVYPYELPPRLLQEIRALSPEESIHLLQRIQFSTHSDADELLLGIQSAIKERLVDIPTLNQLKLINTVGYLNGSVEMEEVVRSRIQWHCESKRPHPDVETAILLFKDVEILLLEYLKNRDHSKLATLTDSLQAVIQDPAIEAVGDIFALAVFCTMRKVGMQEVYVEVTDRNPLFNDQTDQAAAFSELFALGSRCEAYFDVSPSQFGQIISQWFRDHYNQDEYQPPAFVETAAGLNTAYTEAGIDVDTEYKAHEMPLFQRFTFMSVFAIPALIDILLLTTTGHGLYLSSGDFMTGEEVHSATTALMISLLLSGAIGTWIACGGTYYMASMAFSAMNYLVITRLLGGFALTLIAGLIGFIAFYCTTGGHAAVVFLFYLIVLTSYLCLLAALANYQFTGSAFQSGRGVIIVCIPVLFISPITTMFVKGHDIKIYLTVLFVFVTLLLLGVRYLGSKWTTWYQKIQLISDADLRSWYIEKVSKNGTKNDISTMSDPAILREARKELKEDVLRERKQGFFGSKSQDPTVSKLANSYESTSVLMNWYCTTTGVPHPIMFSSTWNMSSKVALNSLQKTQLGIRFHNGFLHWRQAGDEIGCTMLYFIVALLDKWIVLLSGGGLVGLASSGDLTMPIGLGLAYYLIGAVLLDANAHKLNELAAKNEEKIVPTDADIKTAVQAKAANLKKIYWQTLMRYLLLHVWGLAITCTLLWLFTSDATNGKGVLVFLSYVVAYTGVLWYQYTKIFTGPHALKPLLVGVFLGFPLGFILRSQFPDFIYTDIIALGTATWTVAILSLWAAKILGPFEKLATPRAISGKAYRAYSSLGPDQGWSQPEIQGLLEQLTELPENQLLPIDPSSEFGHEVQQILTDYSHTELSELAERAFPEAAALVRLSKALFDERMITIELVALGNFAKYRNMRAVSSIDDAHTRVVFGCDITGIQKNEGLISGFVQDIAELLIQVAAEYHMKYTARDAFIVQSLWSEHEIWTNESGPSLLERQLKIFSKTGDPNDLLEHLNKELARDLCLGFDCDLKWDKLPGDLREALTQRCLGNATPFTETQLSYLKDNLGQIPDHKIDLYLARCDYSVYSNTVAIRRARSWISGSQSMKAHQSLRSRPSVRDVKRMVHILEKPYSPPKLTLYDRFLKYSGAFYHSAGTLCKFFSIAFVADPEFQREMKCTFGNIHLANRVLIGFLLLIWKWSQAIQRLLLPTFLMHGRPKVQTVWNNLQGTEVSLKRKRVLIRKIDGVQTGFVHPTDGDMFRLLQYKGDHKTEPTNETDLCAINMYSKDMALLRRVVMNKGNTLHDYEYHYRIPDPTNSRKISRNSLLTSPMTREETSGEETVEAVEYNAKGQIDSGSYLKDGNLVRFQYHYQKATKHLGALLRAEYVLPHMSCTVCWSAPPRRKAERLESWIPHDQVIEASFVVGADVWESQYYYDHKHHPTIVTTLNGEQVDTPPLIQDDHLGVLKKPSNVSFLDDNPLYSFKSVKSNIIARWLGMCTRHYPVSTAQARSSLWKAWKDDPNFDGVIARWMDERLLRREPVLAPYWRKRDYGQLKSAETYLDDNRDAVMATVDLDSTISSWTPLAIKINDLYSFGQGGDACSRTRSNVAEDDDTNSMHVVAVDTGTWPNEGGGVSACRRDVINNLRSIKWHMVAESANDFGIPKNQIERNVHSLKIIPLWGLDLMTPIHGLFTNRLDSEINHLATHTTLLDIEQTFVPILTAIVNGSRAQKFDLAHIKQLTRSLINLNEYFSDSQNWSAVWTSDVVKSAWRKLWLSQSTPNARPSSQWLKTELPTLGQLDQGLDLWSRYLFIFSIPVPEKMPAVFQTSHHSVSASYGVVCKIKRGCTLQIWDHAISWRETNLYLSSALCSLSPFTRNSLLGLMRMTSVLILHHADTILPCADFFNPGWEVEIGTCEGTIEHPAAFRRKIDPVVNGITNMERFTPVKEIKTTVPTVTMLSHIWFAKDIKTALLSADIIINKWGFKDYKLEIYGALDKTPSYTTSCQEIVATKSLRGQVQLCGEANPIDVLQRTWVFLNSSISEGLPLALGEAALTGAPVVCTDVGASLRVLTNQEDNTCYSEVVAPNDAFAMARAQIKILGMLEEWDKYADKQAYTPETKDASFPVEPTPEDVARITKRMYEQAEARRKLGMMSREIVQKAFSGDRYLREHEQMLWIGKARKKMSEHRSKRLSPSGHGHLRPPQRMRLPERPSSLVQMRIQRPSLMMRDSYQRDRSPGDSFGGSFRTNSPQPSSLQNVSLPSLAFSTEGPFHDGMRDSHSLSSTRSNSPATRTPKRSRSPFHRAFSSNSMV